MSGTICIGGFCFPTYALIPIGLIVLQSIWEWIRKNVLGHNDDALFENSRVIHVTSEEQWKELHTKSKTTKRTLVVDFTASWCGPCRFIAPFYHELSTKYPCSIFLKVDVDEMKSIARSCGVNAMPTFQVFKHGSKVQELCGADKKALETIIQQHYNEVELPEEKVLKESENKDGLQQRHVNVLKIHSVKEWEELQQTSKTSGQTVVVDFTATWCGPCKKIAPFFEQLSVKYPSIIFAKLDVDQVEDVAVEQEVKSMPTFKVYKHGKCIDELNGAIQTALQSMVVRHAI